MRYVWCILQILSPLGGVSTADMDDAPLLQFGSCYCFQMKVPYWVCFVSYALVLFALTSSAELTLNSCSFISPSYPHPQLNTFPSRFGFRDVREKECYFEGKVPPIVAQFASNYYTFTVLVLQWKVLSQSAVGMKSLSLLGTGTRVVFKPQTHERGDDRLFCASFVYIKASLADTRLANTSFTGNNIICPLCKISSYVEDQKGTLFSLLQSRIYCLRLRGRPGVRNILVEMSTVEATN
ncbi:unnamed protein product [Dovyalis caffra]|uniref:Uncharacterized protein n=1 Tax=Dovyalis caffra TaxID=77055 RepID=A0AAV1RJD8_9ROSI|nr:unnamed protein product [Dovyalis caffra]